MLAILALAICASPALGQTSAENPPPPKHLELEAKPPDEPSSSASPEVDVVPEANPSTSAPPLSGQSGEGSDAPFSAIAIAHPPEIATYVVPLYPPQARAKGIEGRVLLMVIVDESGKVEDNIQVLDSVPMLDQAAIDAVQQWRFTPGSDAEGNPVRVRLEVPVPFTLR